MWMELLVRQCVGGNEKRIFQVWWEHNQSRYLCLQEIHSVPAASAPLSRWPVHTLETSELLLVSRDPAELYSSCSGFCPKSRAWPLTVILLSVALARG